MFPKEWRKHSVRRSTLRRFLFESSVRGSRFDVVPPDAVRQWDPAENWIL